MIKRAQSRTQSLNNSLEDPSNIMAPNTDIEEGFKCDDDEIDGNVVDTNRSTPEEDSASDQYTHIVIPRPGLCSNGEESVTIKMNREVPLFCAVCLSEYEVNDEISWSSNSECTHVFHRECITQWLVALGKKNSSMRRFPDSPSEEKLLNYNLECPCCRQDFIVRDKTKCSDC